MEDLLVASPATVSRCGMVYMEPHALGISPLYRSWLDAQHHIFSDDKGHVGHSVKRTLYGLFEKLLEPSIEFVRKQCIEPVPSVDNNLVASLLRLLDCLLRPYVPIDSISGEQRKSEAELAALRAHLEPLFLWSLVWSVGATTDKAGRLRFDAFLRTLAADFGINDLPPAKVRFIASSR